MNSTWLWEASIVNAVMATGAAAITGVAERNATGDATTAPTTAADASARKIMELGLVEMDAGAHEIVGTGTAPFKLRDLYREQEGIRAGRHVTRSEDGELC